MKGVGMAALLAGALLFGACGGDDSAGGSSGEAGEAGGGGSTVTVVAQDFSFDTTELEFEPGAEVTVTLDNQGEAEHTFSIEELDVEAEAQGGETAEATFTMPDSGSLEFFCEYHPDDMTGTLSVIGATGGGDSDDEGAEEKDDSGGGAPGGGY
jgi:plastocyanin